MPSDPGKPLLRLEVAPNGVRRPGRPFPGTRATRHSPSEQGQRFGSAFQRLADVLSRDPAGLELRADSSTLAAGEHRKLTVTVSGTTSRISLDATNLAPDIAELVGGNTVRHSSSGGAENAVHFEVIGRRHGRFLISIRLTPITAHPVP